MKKDLRYVTGFMSSKYVAGWLTVIAIILLWQFLSNKSSNSYLVPTPEQVYLSFITSIKSGQWLQDVLASLLRFICGFLIGNIIGITIGIVTGRYLFLRHALSPVLNFLRSIPSIALIPLAIIWLGIGEQEKIIIISWGVFFPVWINTHSGIAEVETEYLWAAESLGAKGWELIKSVYIPRASPYIVAGSRIGIATGFFALAAGEMVGAFDGIAFRIFNSHQMFQTDTMMVFIITIGVVSFVFDYLFVKISKLCFPWLSLKDNDFLQMNVNHD